MEEYALSSGERSSTLWIFLGTPFGCFHMDLFLKMKGIYREVSSNETCGRIAVQFTVQYCAYKKCTAPMMDTANCRLRFWFFYELKFLSRFKFLWKTDKTWQWMPLERIHWWMWGFQDRFAKRIRADLYDFPSIRANWFRGDFKTTAKQPWL